MPPIRQTVSAGVPQESVLSPLLWNIMYDAITPALPKEVKVAGFIDDIVGVVVGEHIHKSGTETTPNTAIWRIQRYPELVFLDRRT